MKITDAQIGLLGNHMEKDFPQICFAYLFGSVATGNNTRSSDIDIAVYLAPEADKLKTLTGVIGLAENTFAGKEIDIVVLNDSDVLIAFEALKGKILFIRDNARDLHAGFYSLTCRLAEDQLVWMKRQLIYRGYEVQWGN